MRGKVVKPWDIPPSNECLQCVVSISEMDKSYSDQEFLNLFKNFKVRFCHTFGKNAIIEFDNHNTAVRFIQEFPRTTLGLSTNVQFSSFSHLQKPNLEGDNVTPSRVIRIQIINLQVSLGICDIYDECSKFGTVEKIICFENERKFALVQMHSIKEAALIMVNLSDYSKYYPNFQLKIQYSKNQDIVIQYNNSKSFDFTNPGALPLFAQLRHEISSDYAFFTPVHSDKILDALDLWRPVPIDEPTTQMIEVTGFDSHKITCKSLFNLFSQYGMVQKISLYTSKSIVYMMNQFSARMVFAHLQNCPFGNGNLTLNYPILDDLSSENEYPYVTKDYTDQMIEIDLSDYGKMWPPSDTVSFDGADVSSIKIPPKGKIIPERNAIKFPTILDAVMFISKRPYMSNDLVLRFTY